MQDLTHQCMVACERPGVHISSLFSALSLTQMEARLRACDVQQFEICCHMQAYKQLSLQWGFTFQDFMEPYLRAQG